MPNKLKFIVETADAVLFFCFLSFSFRIDAELESSDILKEKRTMNPDGYHQNIILIRAHRWSVKASTDSFSYYGGFK